MLDFDFGKASKDESNVATVQAKVKDSGGHMDELAWVACDVSVVVEKAVVDFDVMQVETDVVSVSSNVVADGSKVKGDGGKFGLGDGDKLGDGGKLGKGDEIKFDIGEKGGSSVIGVGTALTVAVVSMSTVGVVSVSVKCRDVTGWLVCWMEPPCLVG